jgi:excisionase family DNA binding protein
MKSCYEIITAILTQNGKTQPNNMNASESNTNEQPQNERIAYSIPEAAEMLGLDYFSVYRLVQRGKLKACRALRGKFLISRTELFRLLNTE